MKLQLLLWFTLSLVGLDTFASTDSLQTRLHDLNQEISRYFFARDKVQDSVFFKAIDEGKSLSKQLQDDRSLAHVLRSEGLFYAQVKGNLGMAASKIDSAFSMAFQSQDSVEISRGHFAKANLFLLRGKNEEALPHLLQSLEYVSRGADDVEMLQAFYALAKCYELLREKEEAQYFYNKVLGLQVKELGNLPKITYYKIVADAYHSTDQYNQSEVFLNKIMQADTTWLSTYDLMDIHFKLGTLASQREQDDLARSHYHTSLGLGRRLKDSLLRPETRFNLGLTCAFMGDRDSAKYFLKAARDDYNRLGRHEEVIDCYKSLGNIHYTIESYVKAQEYFNKAVNRSKEIGDTTRLVASYMDLADAYFGGKQYESSKSISMRVISMRSVQIDGMKDYVVRSKLNVGDCYFERGKFSTALAEYEEALEWCDELDVVERKSMVYYNMAWVQMETKKLTKAGISLNKGFRLADTYDQAHVKGQICEASRYLKYQLKYEGSLPKICETY